MNVQGSDPRVRRGHLLVVAAVLSIGAGCAAMGGGKPAPGDVEDLAQSGDMSGLVQVLDSPWKIEGGVISSAQNPAGRLEGESWLLTKKTYTDCIVELEFRITPGGNSGVFLRDPVSWPDRLAAADGGTPPWDAGYEVNINNDHETYPTGSVWALASAPPKLQKEGEWNKLEIRLQGQRISTWVNGKVALDDVALPARSTRGAIGFQRHGTPQYKDKLIELRGISIRELR